MEQLDEKVLEIVNKNSPIKLSQIILEVKQWGFDNNILLESKEIKKSINISVEKGNIIKLIYILPQTIEEKILYFSKGTVIQIE